MITTTVRARVKPSIKELAAARADRLGLSLSTVMSIFVTKFAFEGNLPEIYADDTPNAETLAAIEDADGEEGETFKTPEALFKHLGTGRHQDILGE